MLPPVFPYPRLFHKSCQIMGSSFRKNHGGDGKLIMHWKGVLLYSPYPHRQGRDLLGKIGSGECVDVLSYPLSRPTFMQKNILNVQDLNEFESAIL